MLNELVVRVWTWFHREEGQDLIEYALIVTALSIGIIVVIAAGGIPDAFADWAGSVVDKITVPVPV